MLLSLLDLVSSGVLSLGQAALLKSMVQAISFLVLVHMRRGQHTMSAIRHCYSSWTTYASSTEHRTDRSSSMTCVNVFERSFIGADDEIAPDTLPYCVRHFIAHIRTQVHASLAT